MSFGALGDLAAAPLFLPNGSFEAPTVSFVAIDFDSWQKTPKPPSYIESADIRWNQLTGLFKNTPPGAADHIDNCDGNQAAWLFAVPEVGLFQEAIPNSGNTNATGFAATFAPGEAYRLSAGFLGLGGGNTNEVPLELGFFYRDQTGDQIRVAATFVTNSPANFTNRTHLLFSECRTEIVKASDPWAGKPMGVRLLSIVSPELQGGYWGVDNVRLTRLTPLSLSAAATADARFELTVTGEPATVIELLHTADIQKPLAEWIRAGLVTNVTGTATWTTATAGDEPRLYRARELP